jgi:plastocyanin
MEEIVMNVNVNVRRFAVLFGLIALLSLPALVSAQGGYPSGGGSSGGGIQVGGGSSGGGNGNMGDVTIVDFAFQPSAIFAHSGDTVTWYNAGGHPHTVDADSGAFESPILEPRNDYSVTFDTGGVYFYHCDIHPNMKGMVVVTGA